MDEINIRLEMKNKNSLKNTSANHYKLNYNTPATKIQDVIENIILVTKAPTNNPSYTPYTTTRIHASSNSFTITMTSPSYNMGHFEFSSHPHSVSSLTQITLSNISDQLGAYFQINGIKSRLPVQVELDDDKTNDISVFHSDKITGYHAYIYAYDSVFLPKGQPV